MEFKKIKIQTSVNQNADMVWRFYTEPEHVMEWNYASVDWHCPKAKNDLREGGSFCYTMASKDGKTSFNFEGVYEKIDPYHQIAYVMEDGRTVSVFFNQEGDATEVSVDFDAEGENTLELQKQGWQAILDNFKKYAEV